MNIKYLLPILIFFAITISTASGQSGGTKKIVIAIERAGGYGRYPAYSAQIFEDGTVTYNGKYFVGVVGDRSHKITKEKLAELIKAFEDIKYFSLKDEYRYNGQGMTLSDHQTTITSYTKNGKTKKVIDYAFAPAELEKLEQKVDETAQLYRYIATPKRPAHKST